MAKDSTVNNAAQTVSKSVQGAANNVGEDLQSIATTLNGAIANLGDGLKLTLKETAKQDKKTTSKTDFSKLKAQLDGLRVFCPELADMAETLIDINTELISSGESITANASSENESEEEQAANINTSATETSDLNGLTSLVEITGTGFSIVGNALKGLTDLFSTVLEGIAPGQLNQVLLATEAGNTIEEKADEAEGSTKGKLAEFFKGLAGPLESIASGMLLLAVSMTILNAIQFDSQLLGTVIMFQTFMLFLFGTLTAINLAYQAVSKHFDITGEQEGSILNIVKQFAMMVGLTAATLLLSGVIVKIISDTWTETLTGLVIIFGTALVTIVALDAVALLISNTIGEESNISNTIKSFAELVLMIATLAIFCAFFYETILSGMTLAIGILGVAMLSLTALALMIAQIDLDAGQLEAFSEIMKMMIVLIGIISVFTIVLGLIPQNIIIQGLMAVTAITLLVDSLIFMLTRSIEKIENISQEKLEALKGILITSTVLIGILGVLVVVLGLIEPTQLIQGIAAVTLLTALPIVMIKLLSKVAEQSGQLVQALEGIGIAALVSVAVAGLAWLLITILGDFTAQQVAVTMLTMTLMVAMIAIVSLAIVGIGTLAAALVSGPQAALIPLSFVGIAIAGAVSIAVAGLARLLAVVLPAEEAQAALQAAAAIILTTTALVVVGSAIVLLGGLAIPLLATSGLALIAVNVISKFLKTFALTMASTIEFVATLFANLDTEQLNTAVEGIAETVKAFVTLSVALLTFNTIAITLTAQLVIATTAMLGVNIGLAAFMLNYAAFTRLLSTVPLDSIDLTGLGNSISELNNMSQIINEFTAPTLSKMLALSSTLTFVESFTKRLSKLGDNSSISRVNNLATSLSALAQNAGGLTELATAIKAVADATKDLNEVNEVSKISVEAISGQAQRQATELSKLEKPRNNDNNSELKVISEQLTDTISTLRELADGIQSLVRNTNKISETQEFASQRARAAYID